MLWPVEFPLGPCPCCPRTEIRAGSAVPTRGYRYRCGRSGAPSWASRTPRSSRGGVVASRTICRLALQTWACPGLLAGRDGVEACPESDRQEALSAGGRILPKGKQSVHSPPRKTRRVPVAILAAAGERGLTGVREGRHPLHLLPLPAAGSKTFLRWSTTATGAGICFSLVCTAIRWPFARRRGVSAG